MWNTTTGDRLFTRTGAATYGPCLTAPRNGSWLAAAVGSTRDAVGEIVIWDARTLTPRCVLPGPGDDVCALAASHDGSWLTAGYQNRGNEGSTTGMAVWDTASGTLRNRLVGPATAATAFAVAPDDSWLVSGHGEWISRQRRRGAIAVWDPPTGAHLHAFDCAGPVAALAVSPDGTRLAATVDRPRAGGGGEIRVWSTDRWRPLAALRVAGTLEPVVWAKDIVVAGGDRGVYCLRLRDA